MPRRTNSNANMENIVEFLKGLSNKNNGNATRYSRGLLDDVANKNHLDSFSELKDMMLKEGYLLAVGLNSFVLAKDS